MPRQLLTTLDEVRDLTPGSVLLCKGQAWVLVDAGILGLALRATDGSGAVAGYFDNMLPAEVLWSQPVKDLP